MRWSSFDISMSDHLMNLILSFFTAASLFLFVADSASAQARTETLEDLMADPPVTEPRRKEFNGTLPLFDSLLIHPMPDWMPQEIQGNPITSTRFNRKQGKNVFLLEMMPREEKPSEWRNLYAVLGFRNYRGTNETHARLIGNSFKTGCKPSNLNVRPLQGNPKIALLVVACGSFARQTSIGEVAAFVLLQRGTTAVRLYRQWRGPAFRSEDPQQWPVTRKSLDRIIGKMIRARLGPLSQLPVRRQ